jgi:5'-nucleotidase
LDAVYKVATNNYVRGEGDGPDVSTEKAINPYDLGPTLADSLADYVAAHSPVATEVEGRITQDDTAGPTELPATGGVAFPWLMVLAAAGFALAGAGTLVRSRRD